MAKTPIIQTVTNSYTNANKINENFNNVASAFSNTLSRDGSTPNQMNADIDLNSNDLLNVGQLNAADILLNGQTLLPLVTAASSAAVSAAQASASAIAAAASAAAALAVQSTLPNWRGPWVTARAYALGNLSENAGSTYICVIAHTSGTFATDLSAGRWALFAQKGSAGAGTGDVLSTNNGSDFANKPATLANLGGQPVDATLTALAGLNTTAGLVVQTATDTFTKRTITAGSGIQVANGAGIAGDPIITAAGLTLTNIDAATIVTAAETISANNNDTTLPTSAAVKSYVDAAVSVGSSYTNLGILATTSGTIQTISGLNLTSYKYLLIVAADVSHNSGTNQSLLCGGIALNSPARDHSAKISGTTFLDLQFGSLGDFNSDKRTSINTASTSISFTWTGGASFDGGAIKVIGVK